MAPFNQIANKYQVLKQIPIFSKLNWFELHSVASKANFIEFKKGDIVCLEGAPPDALYCVVSGRLHAYKTRPNGDRESVELILRGMHFGIISLLTGEQHSLTFQAINDCIILKINKDDFMAILKAIPRLGIEFSRSLSRRIRSQVIRPKSIFESTIISIYSAVKGSGSSTFAVNLAFSLARETKRKVIYINILSGANSVSTEPTKSYETSPRWKKPAVALKDIIGDHEKIAHNIHAADLPVALLSVSVNPQEQGVVRQISQFISSLANDFHYVVVDLPNDMDDVVLETLIQSDLVLLVSVDQKEDLLLAGHVLERLKEVLKGHFDKDKVQVILSCLRPKCYLSFEEVNKILNYQVTGVLPFIDPSELKQPVVSDYLTVLMPNAHSEYAKTVTHLARKIGGVLVGLVLGGGAALGVAHVGVIRVLEKEGIPVDVVVGSSMGALIGALWASGKNADQLELVAREFEKKKSLSKLMDPGFPKSALMKGNAIERWLRKHMGTKTFHGNRFPLKVVAYDLLQREEIVISQGSLVDAVRKSIAIPGVIAPILEDHKLIIDGGVLNPLPTNVLAGLGIKKIIAVNVLQSPADAVRGYAIEQAQEAENSKVRFLPDPGKYLGIHAQRMLRKLFWPNISDIIVRSLQATEYVISQQSATQADIMIHPDLAGINWFELYQVNRLLRCGEEATYKLLPEIKKLVQE